MLLKGRDRNDKSKKSKPKELFQNDEARKKKISGKTGADLSRLDTRGRLRSEAGSRMAVAPDYKEYKARLEKVKSPYAMLLTKIGSKTGVEYGESSRKARTQSRLKGLSNKLSKPNPIGNTKTKTSGYGDAGTDLLKKYSMAQSLKGKTK